MFQLVSPEEADFNFAGDLVMEDCETGEELPLHAGPFRAEYLQRFNRFCREVSGRCDKLEIEHRRLRTDQPLEQALTFYLEERMAI